MYKIGELSKLCHLPVKTLRYYDSEGLLVPDHVDNFTGYRYYSAARLGDCHRIVALKELGFSLDEIREHLHADSPERVLALIESKRQELTAALSRTEAQLRRLDDIRSRMLEGDSHTFDLVIREAREIRVSYFRDMFADKAQAWEALARMRESLPASIRGQRSVIVNYESTYREKNFDLAVCVEIMGDLPRGSEWGSRTLTASDEVASLVCRTEQLDAAYRDMLRQLEKLPAQIVGAFRETYHDDGTVELSAPIYRPAPWETLQSDDIDLPFENDARVIGKWKMLDIVPSEEQFRYGHEKSIHLGWLDEIYFLEGGAPYWAVRGWTRGYIYTGSEYPQKHRYTVREIDGHTLLFLEMKDFLDGGRQMLAAPEIWVYEKVSDEIFRAEDLRRRDFVDYPFVPDEKVLGRWRVRDFYCWDLEHTFDPTRQNFPSEELFYLEVEFFADGHCHSVTKNASYDPAWTKGFILDYANEIACAYELRTVDGAEYLIVEWKTGDYQYGSDGRIYWYIFVRA